MILWPCDFFVSAPPLRRFPHRAAAVIQCVRRPSHDTYHDRRTTVWRPPYTHPEGAETICKRRKSAYEREYPQHTSIRKVFVKETVHSMQASGKLSRKRLFTVCKHRKSGRERDCPQHASAIRNRREWSRRFQLSMTPRHPAKRVTWRWGQIRRRPTLEESPDTPQKCWRW